MLTSVFPNLLLLTVSVALPLVAALAVVGLGEQRAEAARIVARGTAAVPFVLLALLAFRLDPQAGLQLGDRLDFWPEVGMSLALAVDGLSLPFALIAAALGVLGVLAAKQSAEAAVTLVAQAIAILLFVAEDLFVFLAAWWVLPLLLSTLISRFGRQDLAGPAATKRLMLSLTGAALLSVSLVAMSMAGGNTASMAALWMSKPAFPLAALNHAVLAGILAATWMAAPLFPFQSWSADALEAAPPSAVPLLVGGLFAGAAYALVRLAFGMFPGYVEPWLPYLGGLGVLSALAGGVAARRQPSRLRMRFLVGAALAGLVPMGFAAVMGDAANALRLTLTAALALTWAGGLVAWLGVAKPSRTRRLAAGYLLASALPLFWLVLGNRAVALFASQLSLGIWR